MTGLALAALGWVLLHVIVAGPLRPWLVGRLGLPRYRGLFTILSFLALGAMIWTFRQAPVIELWPAIPALNVVPIVVMPVAALFLLGSLRKTNPTMAGPDMVLKGELPVTGFIKITRHPMLWAFSLWAASHMIANSDLRIWLLAGAILITAVNGMHSIDRKRQKDFGEQWHRFAERTSIIPFVAAIQGRIKLRFADIGWANVIGAAILYGLILWAHVNIFDVPVYP